ncbi:MAG: hypothetical protein HS114_01260 [Anaerolineales bacterium]|nr:hypothetical protein [Anaerolineales bacterium]
MKLANARGSADCGRARLVPLTANPASKKCLKNRAVAIRLQRPLPAAGIPPPQKLAG